MSGISEITVPETKPATEWVNGRALQKVSPKERHGRAQLRLAAALLLWADQHGLGRVRTEWGFRIAPPGEPARPLVPDVAYLSYERVAYEDAESAQLPVVSPDVAVEILSEGDLARDTAEKVRVYLAAGTSLVLVADTANQTLTAYDAGGLHRFAADEKFTHPSLPGFDIGVGTIFGETKPHKPA